MKLLKVILFLTGISGSVFAQSKYRSDSIARYDIQQSRMHFLLQHPVFIHADKAKDYGIADLQYQKTKGSYKRAQQPYSSDLATFNVEGFSTLGRFVVAGSFNFYKQWDDSLANTLKGVEDEFSPFYYFVGKHSKYERQQYRGSASLSYQMIPEKLHVALRTDYLSHWTTRSVDPRPDVATMELRLSPQVAYEINQKHFNAGLTYGYGVTETRLLYKSTVFSQSFLYPDRIYYTNQGYGYISQKDSSQLRTYHKYIGYNLNYMGTHGPWEVIADAAYLKKTETNTYDTKLRSNYRKRAVFELQTVDASLMLNKKNTHREHQLFFKAQLVSGTDFNYSFNANNYEVQQHALTADYKLLFKSKGSWDTELGLSAAYLYHSKHDAASAHHIEYSLLQPEMSLTFYKRMQKQELLKLQLVPGVTLPLNTVVNVPKTQQNLFTEQVAYPDFYYYSSRVYHGKVHAEYLTPNCMKRYTFSLFATADLAHQASRSTLVYDARNIPSGNRGSFNLGMRIYL